MSGMIILSENLVRLPSRRIARQDVRAVREAADLMAEATRIRDETQAAYDSAQAQGYLDGQAAARSEMAEALGELAAAFACENARRANAVGAAAIAVVEQLIGAREPTEIVTGLASEALRTAGVGDDVCLIEVAPDLLDPVSAHFRDAQPAVRIEANPTLGTLGCRVLAGDSRIIADLDTQLETLRTRWGLPKADGASQ